MSNIQIFKNFAEFIKSNYVSTLILTILMALLYSILSNSSIGLFDAIYITFFQTFLVFFGKKFLLFENSSEHFSKIVNIFEENNKLLLKESFFNALGFVLGLAVVYIIFKVIIFLLFLIPKFPEYMMYFSMSLYLNSIFNGELYKILILLFISNYFTFFIYKEITSANNFIDSFKKVFLIFNPLFYIKTIRFKYLKMVTIWATISTVLDLVNDNWHITQYIFLLYTAMLISSLLYHEQNLKSK